MLQLLYGYPNFDGILLFLCLYRNTGLQSFYPFKVKQLLESPTWSFLTNGRLSQNPIRLILTNQMHRFLYWGSLVVWRLSKRSSLMTICQYMFCIFFQGQPIDLRLLYKFLKQLFGSSVIFDWLFNHFNELIPFLQLLDLNSLNYWFEHLTSRYLRWMLTVLKIGDVSIVTLRDLIPIELQTLIRNFDSIVVALTRGNMSW